MLKPVTVEGRKKLPPEDEAQRQSPFSDVIGPDQLRQGGVDMVYNALSNVPGLTSGVNQTASGTLSGGTSSGTTAMLVCLGCLLCNYILTYCAWWFLDELLAAWLWNMGKPVFFICMSICTWGVSLLPLVLLYKFVWLPFTGETIF